MRLLITSSQINRTVLTDYERKRSVEDSLSGIETGLARFNGISSLLRTYKSIVFNKFPVKDKTGDQQCLTYQRD